MYYQKIEYNTDIRYIFGKFEQENISKGVLFNKNQVRRK